MIKIVLVILFFASVGFTEEDITIEKRIFELEQKQAEFNQWYTEFYLLGKGRVSPFLYEKISFGGYFETAITHAGGRDTLSQTSAHKNALGLNIAAEFSDKIHFVTQFLTGLTFVFQNPHNNPNLTPAQRQYGAINFDASVAQGYLEYRKSDSMIIQSGLGYVPFGYSFQQRDPVLFKRRGAPQMVSASDAITVGVASPLWSGIHLLGSFAQKSARVGYNLYSFSPFPNAKTLGGGTRLWWSDSQHIKAGLSLQSGEQANSSYYSFGVDIDYRAKDTGVMLEYARNSPSGGLPAITSYYAEPYYVWAEGVWLVYAAIDYLNNPTRTVGAVADGFERWQLGGGVNWLPVPSARVRFGVLQHDYIGTASMINGQERDYYTLDFSVATAF